MNSHSIFSFLNPLAQTVKEPLKAAGGYIERMIKAISVARALEQTGETATSEEIETIGEFFGYGKSAKAFEPSHALNGELKAAFGDDASYQIAKRGVLHSYFTPTSIVGAMWRAVCRLGLLEGRVIEPACGSGQFIKHAHPNFTGRFYGVELDPTAGIIARQMNPDAKIYINQRFEHAKLPNSGEFDLAITNTPWGSIRAHDRRFGNISIHNYFILRSLAELKTGGLMAVLVTSWFLDASNDKTRRNVARKANLIAAIRLPNDALKSETVNLPTDILIFQKSDTPIETPDWLHVGEHESGAEINQHFINHPERVLGDITKTEYLQFSSCNVEAKYVDFEKELNNSLDMQTSSPCFYSQNKSLNTSHAYVDVTPDSEVARYELFSIGDEVYQRVDDTLDLNGVPVAQYQELGFHSDAQKKKVLAYITVKNALNALLDAEKANESINTLSQCREDLNLLHKGFLKVYGALSRSTNKNVLSQCSMYLRVKSLEINYVAPNNKEGIKESFDAAKILSSRVFRPFTPATSAKDAKEAISICLNEKGALCSKHIADLLNVSQQEATDTLLNDGLAYVDPDSLELIDSTSYLSGNVRTKLATTIKQQDPQFDKNIQALQAVIPADLTPEEITVVLGANWVTEKHYEHFANSLMGENAAFQVAYIAGKWHVKAGGTGYWGAMTTTWGTNKRDFSKLLENAMNGTQIKITKTVNGVSEVDKEATAEACSKVDEIIAEFDEWVWTCPLRRAELSKTYNDNFNNFVTPDYGQLAHNLSLEGCAMTPHAYQNKAILRGVLANNTLFDCCVGSGKTLILQSVVMILKRIYGSSERPAIVMPNALVPQFANAMASTYPSANAITLEAELSPAKRESILNMAMTNDFDLLIIPESTFTALQAPKETEEHMMRLEIEDLENALAVCEERDFNMKQIQNRLEKKEAALEELINAPRLNSITWDDLNITSLLVDEIQIFKNMPYTTTFTNIRGMGTPLGSKKAWDFLVKARDTQDKGGRVIGGTGSSLSNSITEAVTWFRVFAPELADVGLHNVDAFIRQFSNPVTEYALASTGRTLKSTTSLKRFQNLSELLMIYRNFAETLSTEQLKDKLPALPDGRPAIPPLKGGKIQTVLLPISPEQEAAFQKIVTDAQHLTKENNMLKVIDTARKASLDIRHLDPTAINPNNVVNNVCEQVIAVHQRVQHFKGTQAIFLDRSCPSRHKAGELDQFRKLMKEADKGDVDAINQLNAFGDQEAQLKMLADSFSAYDDIESILSAAGLKVAVVHDFKTNAQKTKLKAALNAGHYDVVIGSTFKLGTGWNINKRMVAAHHADLPLRPGDIEQRNGRIQRQQNEVYNQGLIEHIEIYCYSTKQTLDAWFAAVLDRKAKFISQFNNGTLDTREYDAEDEQIDFATLSALVSGNPKLLELVKCQQEVKRLSLVERSYKRKVFRLQDDRDFYERRRNGYAHSLDELYQDEQDIASYSLHDFMVNGTSITDSRRRVEQVLDEMQSRRNHHRKGHSIPLGCIGNRFELRAKKINYFEWKIYLIGSAEHEGFNVDYHLTFRKLLNRLDAYMIKIGQCHQRALKIIDHCDSQTSLCKQELAKPFKYAQTLSDLKSEIKTLEKELAEEKHTQDESKAAA
ncbi:N-6 DNA methylase [Enterovibrio norvegicus]|uniref:N-6 DNA methylase n=1 Tax=Enterovibrio norvegicus TaxID=188144 RepID=UPI000C8237F0|nr:N-6 DNA methylase [Enterovibrio norvegicus]PMH64549.1 hypothetical protein BCU62_15960 [Enterovibrio norvegicus]